VRHERSRGAAPSFRKRITGMVKSLESRWGARESLPKVSLGKKACTNARSLREIKRRPINGELGTFNQIRQVVVTVRPFKYYTKQGTGVVKIFFINSRCGKGITISQGLTARWRTEGEERCGHRNGGTSERGQRDPTPA